MGVPGQGRQLADPLVALLPVAAVVTALLDDLPDTAVILLVVTVNTLIGVIQEIRADRAIAALDQLAPPTARVVRDGADQIVPAVLLARDDLVRLQAGDIVPAPTWTSSTRNGPASTRPASGPATGDLRP